MLLVWLILIIICMSSLEQRQVFFCETESNEIWLNGIPKYMDQASMCEKFLIVNKLLLKICNPL